MKNIATRTVEQHWNAPSCDRVRKDSRRFIDALAERLCELETLARAAQRFANYRPSEYAEFRKLFSKFTEKCQEFQLLSYIAEETLDELGSQRWGGREEYHELEENFRRLQVPMLRELIRTNLRLLKVWDDRLGIGLGLPIGAHETFLETVRVIHDAKLQLMRPRYEALLDEETLESAERAGRLLSTLMQNAPHLFDFGGVPMPRRTHTTH